MPKSVYSTKLDCSSSSPPLSPTLLFSSQVLKNLALLKSLNLHQISLQQIEKSFLRLLHALILVVLVLVLVLIVLVQRPPSPRPCPPRPPSPPPRPCPRPRPPSPPLRPTRPRPRPPTPTPTPPSLCSQLPTNLLQPSSNP